MASDGQAHISLQTLEALETRLMQIEYYVTGGSEYEPEERSGSGEKSTKQDLPQDRLRELGQRLSALTSSNKIAADILNLHNKHPELFPEDLVENNGDAYTTEEKFDIVNSSATMYSSTASRLMSMQDTPVPSTETFTSLSSLTPKLSKVELQQEYWMERIAELRMRTALLSQRWAELSIIATNECWVEWQERLLECEKIVRRHEALEERKKQPI